MSARLEPWLDMYRSNRRKTKRERGLRAWESVNSEVCREKSKASRGHYTGEKERGSEPHQSLD